MLEFFYGVLATVGVIVLIAIAFAAFLARLNREK